MLLVLSTHTFFLSGWVGEQESFVVPRSLRIEFSATC
jgi:hypothetical protein